MKNWFNWSFSAYYDRSKPTEVAAIKPWSARWRHFQPIRERLSLIPHPGWAILTAIKFDKLSTSHFIIIGRILDFQTSVQEREDIAVSLWNTTSCLKPNFCKFTRYNALWIFFQSSRPGDVRLSDRLSLIVLLQKSFYLTFRTHIW